MANVTFYYQEIGNHAFSLFGNLGTTDALSASAEAITVELGNGKVVTIEGTDLVYDSFEDNPYVSGTVNAVRVEASDGEPLLSITGLALDANAFGAVVVAYSGDFVTSENILRFLFSGDDVILGSDAHENLHTGLGNDSLDAGDGWDWIYVGPGAATIDGGAGGDLVDFSDDYAGYPVYDTGVSIDLTAGTGTNRDGSAVVISNVEDVLGSLGNDTIVGHDGDNILQGNAGDDSISGGGGNDDLEGGEGNDTLRGGEGDNTLEGGAGDDRIFVGSGADIVEGGEGSDTVDFAEYHEGYPGFDTGVSIDLSADTVTKWDGSFVYVYDVENASGSLGNDTITGDGSGNILYGDAGDDSIFGGGGNDFLSGGEGNDTLDGGEGDDSFELGEMGMSGYYGGNKVLIGGEGHDIARFLNGVLSDFSYAFDGDGNLVFTSKESGGTYTLSGIETITDGITSHTVDDFRQVSIAGQSISEDGVWSLALPEGAYRDGTTFTVTDLGGNQLPAWISFDVTTRTFTGTPPADWNGKVGIKVTANDHGIEKVSTFNLEVAAVGDAPTSLTISGGKILENSFAGKLVGVLHAKDGDGDALTYSLVDDAGGRFRIDGDKIVVADGTKLDYEQAKSHNVTVKVADASGAFTTETFTIEVGDIANEKATGGAGADVIKGGSGKDKIGGGLGKDVLTGGKGQDAFVFNTKASKDNVDKITDFSVRDDSIHLDNKYFAKLGKKGSESSPAKLDKEFFTIGSKAKEKDDYLVYDNKKGVLYYDADGSGKGKAVEIATLSKNLKMTAADFFVI